MGRVQIERYHLHVLRTVHETKNAVNDVLFNRQKHEKGRYSVIDGYSSIFAVNNYLKLVSGYAKRSKVTLKIESGEKWEGDNPSSYLLSRSLNLLQTD